MGAGKNVVIVLSGGNVDADMFAKTDRLIPTSSELQPKMHEILRHGRACPGHPRSLP